MMNRIISYILLLPLVAGMFSACSDSSVDPLQGETGILKAHISFEKDLSGKAVSTYIPATSWALSIKSLRIMLYDNANIVKYSKEVTAAEMAAGQFTWTDVPTGSFTVVAVANSDQTVADYYDNNVRTTINGDPAINNRWGDFNMRSKTINNDLLIYLDDCAFPASVVSQTTGAAEPLADYSLRKAKASPAEIFTAYGTVSISGGASASVTLKLAREVALMRVRLDITTHATEAGLGQLSFAGQDAYLWYHSVPDGSISLVNGATGWVKNLSGAFNNQWSVVIADGTTAAGPAFWDNTKTAPNPAGGSSVVVGSSVINGGDNSTLWRDAVILPNEVSRNSGVTNVDDTKAQYNHQFTIIIGAKVVTGPYVLADGHSTANVGDMVYWSARVTGLFTPNTIREVNLIVRTAGVKDPPGPQEQGSLEITLSAPEPWNNTIVADDPNEI